MPYFFELDSANRIAQCRFEGRVNDDELKECYRVASQLVAMRQPLAGIMNFSAVKSAKVSRQTVLELAKSPPIMPDPGRVRVIIAEPLHIFGLAHLFGFAGQYTRPNLHVVRSEQQAWAIVGVANPQFKAYYGWSTQSQQAQNP